MNIDVLADSIAYQDIFKSNSYIEKGYNLFKKYAYENDIMKDKLMSFFFRKYNDNKDDNLIFIPEEVSDTFLDFSKKTNKSSKLHAEHKLTLYYPSTLIHNVIIFYGFEEYYGEYWYSYFDLTDTIFIFVNQNINTKFFNTFLVNHEMLYEQTKIYKNELASLDLNTNIPVGYFCVEKRRIK